MKIKDIAIIGGIVIGLMYAWQNLMPGKMEDQVATTQPITPVIYSPPVVVTEDTTSIANYKVELPQLEIPDQIGINLSDTSLPNTIQTTPDQAPIQLNEPVATTTVKQELEKTEADPPKTTPTEPIQEIITHGPSTGINILDRLQYGG
jgi:hypothetical protein